jgi:superfamily II DNA helicase RecQ
MKFKDTIAALRGGGGKTKLGVNAAREIGSGMILVAPTNALATDHQRAISNMSGVNAVILRDPRVNAELYKRLACWLLRETDFTVFIVSWEECGSDAFLNVLRKVAANPDSGISVINVDEGHLLCSWGSSMRR